MSLIQIFIATYNRPVLVEKAIRSALDQKFDSFEVILSDNSTNDETETLINDRFKNTLIYKRRKPSLLAIEHLNAILEDVTSDYFMIFHDDDVMYPDMLRELFAGISSENDLLAVGANARIITPGFLPKRLILKKKYGNQIISNRNQMAHQYLIKRGIVPLSSYLYKKEVADKLRFNPKNGGKHCDVAFMMEVSSMGRVLMLRKPLMDYFISNVQDSRVNDFLHRVKLLNYIRKTSAFTNDSYLIKRARIVNLYYEMIQDKHNKTPVSVKRRIRILKLIFKVSPCDFFPRVILKLCIL